MLSSVLYRGILSQEEAHEPIFTNSIQSLLSDYQLLYTQIESVYGYSDTLPPIATECETLLLNGTWESVSRLSIQGVRSFPYLSGDITNKSIVNAFLTDFSPSIMATTIGDTWGITDFYAGANSHWSCASLVTDAAITFQGVGTQFVPFTEADHQDVLAADASAGYIHTERLAIDAFSATLTSRYLMSKYASNYLIVPPAPTSYTQTFTNVNTMLQFAYVLYPSTGRTAIATNGYYGFTCTLELDNYFVENVTFTSTLLNATNPATPTVASARWVQSSPNSQTLGISTIIRLPTLFAECTDLVKLSWDIFVSFEGTPLPGSYSNLGNSFLGTYGSPSFKIQVEVQEFASHAKPRITLDTSTPLTIEDPDTYEASDFPADADPGPTVSNMLYPTDYTALVSYLASLERNDGVVTLSSGHSFYVSSYNRWGNFPQCLFDGTTRSWKTASVGSGGWYIDGHVRNPEGYTIEPYSIHSNPSPYVGGGDIQNIFDTFLMTGEVVTGEYFGIVLPFLASLHYIEIMPLTGFLGQCLGDAMLLGCDDGTSWEIIQELVITSYTNDTWARVDITTGRKFYQFRVVITRLYNVAPVLQIRDVRFSLDAWTTPVTPDIPSPIIPPAYADTLRVSDMEFPHSFTGMTAYMLANEFDDCVQIFSSGMTGETWRDIEDGYRLEVSSITRAAANDSNADLFDGTASTFWVAGSTASNYPYYRMGVLQGEYTANPYGGASNSYSGGTGFYHTTSYDGGSSVAGEWIELKTPFYMLLKSVQFKPRTDNRLRAPKEVYVLARNSTSGDWTLLATLTYAPYTNDVYQSKAVSTANKYKIIRLVITSTIGNSTLTISEAKLVYDAYY